MEMPVTIPVVPTTATAVLLLLHVPPETLAPSVMVAPIHTAEADPVIVPAEGTA